jgi:hypothetical protein
LFIKIKYDSILEEDSLYLWSIYIVTILDPLLLELLHIDLLVETNGFITLEGMPQLIQLLLIFWVRLIQLILVRSSIVILIIRRVPHRAFGDVPSQTLDQAYGFFSKIELNIRTLVGPTDWMQHQTMYLFVGNSVHVQPFEWCLRDFLARKSPDVVEP